MAMSDLAAETLVILKERGGQATWADICTHLKAKGLVPPDHRPEDEGLDPDEVVYASQPSEV